MTAVDPFEQLRATDAPAVPDRRFVTALRGRIVAALDAAGLPTVTLPERSTAMADIADIADTTDTTDTASTTAPTVATSRLTPYLSVTGAAGAIDWYVDVLGATELVRYTGDDGRIGHAEVSIGGAPFMLSDEYPEVGHGVVSPRTLGGTTFAMHLTVPDVDAVYARAVSAGVEVDHPPQDEAYGARSFGMIDPYGHRWMIQTPIATPTTAEIEAAMGGYTITTSVATATAPEASGGPVVELGYFTLGVPDTARAGRFYGALFGWETHPGNLGDEYAHVENTTLPLGLTPGAAADAPVLYFRVDDVSRDAARVLELGGEVLEETTYDSGPNAVCRDDQGREFQLWQPAPGYE